MLLACEILIAAVTWIQLICFCTSVAVAANVELAASPLCPMTPGSAATFWSTLCNEVSPSSRGIRPGMAQALPLSAKSINRCSLGPVMMHSSRGLSAVAR